MDKIKQQKEREAFQNECVSLSLLHKHLLIEAATGTGKGLAVAKCIEASKSPLKWLVVVPEQLQVENYKQDLVKHGYDWLLRDRIEDVICYASFKNWAGKSVNLHFNEVHRLSDLRWEIAQTMTFDQIISDSATINQDIYSKLYRIAVPETYYLPLDEAINRGILPAPEIHIVYVSLDRVIKRNKIKFGKITKLVTDQEYSDYLDKNISYWALRAGRDLGKPFWIMNKVLRMGGDRKKFLSDCKTKAAKSLMLSLEDRRGVWFTGSVEQCNELGGEDAVNNTKSKKANLETIERFNNKLTNKVVVNKMGREGMNFIDIDYGVQVQLDAGNDEGLSFLQKTGRTLRGDSPSLYIMVAKDTNDEKYLKKALENIDKKYIVK